MDTTDLITTSINNAITDLTGGDRPRLLSPQLARHVCERLAQQVRAAATSEALLSLQTADDVAAELGVKPGAIRKLARTYQCGWNTGRDWVFRAQDVEFMRSRRGRPGPIPKEQ